MPRLSDPRRLPRRNHYQEGPGFLLLATQGGRPPRSGQSARPAQVVRRRRAALRRWEAGEAIAKICADLGCSRASLYRWQQRYRADGLAGLLDRYRAGGRRELPEVVERLVVTVRLLSYWNSRRLAAEFRRREIWPLSHGQVDRLLARYGTHRPSLARQPGPRYERAAPNELWHIDLKGPFYFAGTHRRGSCHFAGLVDDHSRYLLAIRAVPTREALPILELLAEAVELCGVPLELMTDNGTPFVAVLRSMLSRFQRTLAELAIHHIRTQIDTPWTNGKIEAFWNILQAEVLDRQHLEDLAAAEAAVQAYAGYYNLHRLHGELEWRTPAERFDGTPFTDRGFEHVPALAAALPQLNRWLATASVL
jgi:transposase InsO family protein